MKIYFNYNDKELVLETEIENYLMHYKGDNTLGDKIEFNEINLNKSEFIMGDTSLKPLEFLKDLYDNHNEFRFFVEHSAIPDINNNFVAMFERFEISDNELLYLTVKKLRS